MTSHPRRAGPGVDADGVRTIPEPGMRRLLWLLASALGLVIVATVATILVIRWTAKDAPVEPRAAHADAGSAPVQAAASPVVAAPHASVTPRPTARLRAPKQPAPEAGAPPPSPVDAKDAILALQAAGEHTGIAAFGVPGTKPIKSGIVVPDEFELPPGYVRHYQVTDDGQQLAPILMFHPDYEFLDEHGAPVAVPADRVVPAEMAPPGLALRMLEVPDAPGARQPPP